LAVYRPLDLLPGRHHGVGRRAAIKIHNGLAGDQRPAHCRLERDQSHHRNAFSSAFLLDQRGLRFVDVVFVDADQCRQTKMAT
jgi:hypothetical protein